ncbi:hypothetical protein FJU08_06785 [Martelella alba]|uniref:Uncharacterized protein n=1 Tax=Martelella alba TaxID=2590451 RepID=A0A506UC08_9HYPH|nr:hypothetical protein [Martelella alba]TPW31460.1 hypothetical protein FJU08_06785 [Martelella alba]
MISFATNPARVAFDQNAGEHAPRIQNEFLRSPQKLAIGFRNRVPFIDVDAVAQDEKPPGTDFEEHGVGIIAGAHQKGCSAGQVHDHDAPAGDAFFVGIVVGGHIAASELAGDKGFRLHEAPLIHGQHGFRRDDGTVLRYGDKAARRWVGDSIAEVHNAFSGQAWQVHAQPVHHHVLRRCALCHIGRSGRQDRDGRAEATEADNVVVHRQHVFFRPCVRLVGL